MSKTKREIKIRFVYKLLMGFGTLCIIIGIILIFGDKTIKSTSNLLHTVINEQVRALAKINQLHYRANQIRLLEVELFENSDYYTATGGIDNLNNLVESFEKDLHDFVSTFIPAEDKKASSLLRSWQLYRKGLERSLQYVKTMNMSEAKEISRYSSSPCFQVFSKNLDLISTRIEKITQQGYDDSIVELKMKRYAFLLISIIGITGGVIATYILSRSLSSRISVLTAGALRLADGNMKTPIPIEGNDELTDLAVSFNEMTEKLQKTTTSIDKLNQEIAERKKAQQELAKIKDRLQYLLTSSPAVIHTFQPHGDHAATYISDNISEVFGYTPEEFLADPKFWINHVHPEDRPQIIAGLEGIFEKNHYSNQYRFLHKNGTYRWFFDELRVTTDEKGKPVEIIGSMVDITERKQAEDAIKRAYEELEGAHHQLKETQSQLVQNEKLASIGQLAAGVAHEMNTPVGFVASNFQTLESYIKKIRDMFARYGALLGQIEALGNPELRNTVEGIGQTRDDLKIDFILEDIKGLLDDSREGLERVTSIIQNLRDFSRIDQPGSRDEYDLNKGIEATLVVARNEIKYDADVKTEFSELPMIFCQSGQINQVFLNILVNAAQAIKSQERDKKGTITIKTYTTEDGVVCEISDDGPGIPPENLSKIFDPFFTTKPAGKGTGLGLNVSYDIVVNKHNGRLLVDSTVGEGTKFTIKLPIGTKENDEKEIMNDGKENSIICRR